MSSKAHITSHFATAHDVASRLRIPQHRVTELRKNYDLIAAGKDGSVTVVQFKTVGKKTKAAKSAKRASSTKRAAQKKK